MTAVNDISEDLKDIITIVAGHYGTREIYDEITAHYAHDLARHMKKQSIPESELEDMHLTTLITQACVALVVGLKANGYVILPPMDGGNA